MHRVQRHKRILITFVFFFLFVVMLVGRVFFLQVVTGHHYAWESVAQRSLRYDYYPTGRGQILDRFGKSLLDTHWVPIHVVFPSIADERTNDILQRYTGNMNLGQVYSLSDDENLQFKLGNLPREGIVSTFSKIRYGRNALASHVTGYIQRSGASGPTGLEKSFSDELFAGRPFSLAAFVDARGSLVPGLGYRDLRSVDQTRPYSVITTIDSQKQRVAEQVLAREGESAAIVVMEAKTGDILAMASYPQLNSWEMYSGVSSQRMRELQNDPRAPFVNKAIQQYPPGSVFKVVLAAAALESGFAGKEENYVCTGSIEVGDVLISCFGGEAHGEVDLHEALALSCNSYFIWLGQNLGRQAVTAAAERFKLGSRTGIPLEERAGNIPAVADLPFLGNLAHFSIGQGQVLATPLQLTRMMAIIANNGLDVYPRLVSEIINNQGRRVRYYPAYRGSRAMQPAAARRLRSMLAAVVESGTGQSAESPYYAAIGKTGTAETAKRDISHSWFAGIAEIKGKQLAVTVFLEDSRDGSAAAIFRSVMEQIVMQAED
ncbi:MAG: hypothetical protein KGZ45_05590 [Clostridium sp.]|nr:hypothetical protein [Clostridium sp.]